MAQPPVDSRKTYDAFADKVGLVPNVRLKDNLIQGLVVAAFTLLGAWLGPALIPSDWGLGSMAVGLGALAGLLCGGFVSGLVLMILGLLRKS